MGSKLIVLLIAALLLPLLTGVLAVLMNRPMLLDPPGFAKRLVIYLSYNVAETTADPLLPELRIRRYRVPEDEMKKAVERTLRSLPRWKVVNEEPDLGVYRVEISSRLWRFRDDLSILATGTTRGEMEVYVHSASRVGRGDFGANRAHILMFYEALERQLGSETVGMDNNA